MARGGRRQGTPGQNYGVFRSDLNVNRAPTGPTATPAAPPVTPQSGPPQVALPTQTAAAPAPGPAIPPPGSLGTFNPTQRPGEPLTHGLPTGPGAGPEALPQTFTPDPMVQAATAFQAVPAAHQTPIMRALAAATQASVSNVSNPGVAPGGGQ